MITSEKYPEWKKQVLALKAENENTPSPAILLGDLRIMVGTLKDDHELKNTLNGLPPRVMNAPVHLPLGKLQAIAKDVNVSKLAKDKEAAQKEWDELSKAKPVPAAEIVEEVTNSQSSNTRRGS